jgi:peroxiredoxin
MKTIGILMLAALSTPVLAGWTQDAKQGEKGEKKEVQTPPKEAAKGAELGKPAPDFELKDLDGKTVKLSDYKGKTVVLEWFNPECPVVKGSRSKGTLKGMDERVTKDGVVWLAINSGAPGMEGTGAEKNKKAKADWGITAAILLDEDGVVGRKYGAKTTPHMFIIDAKGNLAYRGGIDNAPGGKAEGDGEVVNYVDVALAELKEGKPVTKNDTKAYGCSVKYGKDKSKEKAKE